MGQHQIHLFTFRKGMAARLGHDLRLSVDDAAIDYRDGHVRVEIAATSLHVDGAVKAGALDPRGLGADDRHTILVTMREQVLEVAAHPTIVYEGDTRVAVDRVDVDGRLTLHGRALPLPLQLRRQGDRLVGEVTLQPSRWGIAPFKALGGTLRVDDRIVVRLDVALSPGADFPPQTLS
jgi:polyisoprenoid-binding protein YceI